MLKSAHFVTCSVCSSLLALLPGLCTGVSASEQAEVVVSGKDLSINGYSTIPDGLFGVHAFPMDAAKAEAWGVRGVRQLNWVPKGNPMRPGKHKGIPANVPELIECLWDRYQPALVLTNPKNWQQQLTDLGIAYGSNAATAEHTVRLEFWNEPYLNWAARPGVNYDPRFYETAGVKEGDPVVIRGMETPTEHLVWKQGWWLYRADGAMRDNINMYVKGGLFFGGPFDKNLRRGAKIGEPFSFQKQDMIVKPALVPYDPTQHERASKGNRWWSGKQNGLWYNAMLKTFGQALKDTNPDVKLAGGWGFHMFQGGWSSWRELYKPMLDENIAYLDAIHEHHYGGDTRMVAASYEAVWAYAQGSYQKHLEFWNTEAGGQLDPQRPDVVKPHMEGSKIEKARGAFTYTMRDIMYLLHWSPDKGRFRAAHHPQHNGGDRFAFQLMKPIRGGLIESRSADRNIWSVASRDGMSMALAVHNDANVVDTVATVIHAPNDARIVSAKLLQVQQKADGSGLELKTTPLTVTNPDQWSGELELSGKGSAVVALTLEAQTATREQVTRTQFASADILQQISADKPFRTKIMITEESLAGLSAARIRMAMVGYKGNGTIRVNGSEYSLENGNWLHQQSIDASVLKVGENVIEFSSTGSGYGIWSVALELDQAAVAAQ